MDLARVAIAARIRIDETVKSVGQARFRRGIWIRRTKGHYLDLIAMTVAGMAAEDCSLADTMMGSPAAMDQISLRRRRWRWPLERSYGMGEKLASYGDLSRRNLEGFGHLDPALLTRVDSTCRSSSTVRRAFSCSTGKLARFLPTNSLLDWSYRDRRCWISSICAATWSMEWFAPDNHPCFRGIIRHRNSKRCWGRHWGCRFFGSPR